MVSHSTSIAVRHSRINCRIDRCNGIFALDYLSRFRHSVCAPSAMSQTAIKRFRLIPHEWVNAVT